MRDYTGQNPPLTVPEAAYKALHLAYKALQLLREAHGTDSIALAGAHEVEKRLALTLRKVTWGYRRMPKGKRYYSEKRKGYKPKRSKQALKTARWRAKKKASLDSVTVLQFPQPGNRNQETTGELK